LLDRRLVKILGRKEAPGRPLMYGTTQEFMQYFGLKDLAELPTLKEFEEMNIPEPLEELPAETGESETVEPGQVDDGVQHVEEEFSMQSQEEQVVETSDEKTP